MLAMFLEASGQEVVVEYGAHHLVNPVEPAKLVKLLADMSIEGIAAATNRMDTGPRPSQPVAF
jgi:hypothetical protein